jgi:hypothetical protein
MFAITLDDRWHPGIGDPTLGGWLTVFAYFVAAWLCWRSALAAESNPLHRRRKRAFWSAFALLLLLLGVNKQLDLQTWFTQVGRDIALSEGWYEHRQLVQTIFIAAIGLVGCLALVFLFVFARRLSRGNLAAVAGAAFLVTFVLIRAASFHHVDRMLGIRLAGLKLNWVLELGGILCIAFAAWRNRVEPLSEAETA